MTERDYRKKLKNKLIEYRDTLNLPDIITFGVEIEYENIVNDSVSCFLDSEHDFDSNFIDWVNEIDLDVSEYGKDCEIMNGEIVSPILTDNINTWKNLKIALDILKRNDAVITTQCGGHVNIGAHVLEYNTNYFRNFLLIWTLYEKEIYSFASGEYSSVRKRNDSIIDRIAPEIHKKLDLIVKTNCDLFDYLDSITSYSKIYDLSLLRVISPNFYEDNRIEIRVPNGTLSEEIWQNNINFFAKLLLTCRKELDVEKLVYKIKKNYHSPVELADLVFKDQIDKDNFLIQTLKTNKIYKKELPKHIIY